MERNNLARSTSTSKQLRYQNRKALRTATSTPIKTASPVYRSYAKGIRTITPLTLPSAALLPAQRVTSV